MSDNTTRFTGKAEAYDWYRQRYPGSQVVALLHEWCGLLPAWTIADVGAGTGMLAEVFLENGNRVMAIEPNREMREVCARLTKRWPQLNVIDATAEATGLADASVDMVAAGRAFHWFNTQRALVEFRRVLKPGGWTALVSAGRAPVENEQALAFERLLVDFGTDHTYARSTYRIHDRLDDLFMELKQAEIAGEQRLSWEMLVGFTQSLSVAPHEGTPGFEGFAAELRRYFERYQRDGILAIETTCWISAGQLGVDKAA